MSDKLDLGWVTIPTEEFERLHAENERLREILGGVADLPTWAEEMDELQREVERLRAALKKGHDLVEDMDLRMPEQATEDADGWINSYRIPVGPWHRLLGWSRGEAQPILGK